MNGLLTRLFTGLLMLWCVQVVGQVNFTITPQNVLVNEGETFTVDIVVNNFTDVASMQFPISWNENIISFQSLSNLNTGGLPGLSMNSFGVPGSGSAPDDQVVLSWNHPNFEGVNLPNGSVLFSITFQGEIGGTTLLEFNENLPQAIEIVNPQGNDLGFVGTDAMITVNGSGGGGGPTGFTMSLPDVTANQGDQICLPVTVTDFTNILGMQFSINYDPGVLTFDMSQNFNLIGLSAGLIGNPSPGNITVSWSDPNVTGVTLTDGTAIVELCFTVSGNATSTVSFSGSPTSIEITDGDENNVDFNSESGTVTVNGGGGGPTGFMLSLPDVTAMQGDQVCLPITVNDFDDILGMQFSINYNSNVLTYTGPQNFNLVGLSAGLIGNPTPGNITFSWSDPSAVGVTLPDGTAIVELCFDVTGTTTSTVSFSGSPTPIEIINGDENTVDFNSESSTVTVNGGGGGPTGFTLSLPNVMAMQGDQVCLPITVNGFDDILGMQFSINYNSNVLTYTGPQNFNLVGLSAGLIGNPTPGNITFSWSDPSAVGVTLPDGTAIVELCFDVAGTTTSTVSFSGSPTPIEIINGDENTVDFNSESSTVTVNGGGGGPTGFTLSLPDVMAMQGDQVCLPITVNDFDDILGMQFSINYNASVLTYTGPQNFNLVGLSAGLIGNPTPGNITFSWSDPSAVGVTLPDGTAIVELCFDVTGTTTSTVSFSGSPTPIEVIDGDENNVDFNSESGTVTINGGGGPMGFTLSLPDVTAMQGDQVCLPITVNDFDDILGMQFSINYNSSVLTYTGPQNFNLVGLSAGLIGNPSPGNITFSWSDPSAVGVTLPDGTAIVELCFDVTGTTTSTVSFSGSPTPIEVIDGDENNVDFNSESGTVTVNGGGGPTGFTLSLPDVTAMQGDQVCLPITVNDFDDILGMQFSINYNSSVLTYTGPQNFNLVGLSAGLIGNPTPGNITFSWSDPSAVGVTLPDGTAIVELCFDVTGTTTSTVSFSGSPTPIEVIDGDENNVDFNSESGTVTINGGGGPMGFTLSLPDVTVSQGDQVCLPITVNDFDNILGMQFSINYNASVLTYTGPQNFNLVGLSAGLIGNPSPGNITFSWSDPSAVGVTLPDGTAIVELCFDVVGNQTTLVEFSGSPTPVEIIDGDENNVDFNSASGTITIDNDPPAGFAIILSDEDACTGDSFCMDVTAQEFINIQGMQFSMVYNTSALSLNAVNNFNTNLPGLTIGNFNTAMAGTITFSWDNTNGNGVDLAANEVLFSLCFDRLSDATTMVQVTGSPTPIEIIDGNENIVEFGSVNGTVSCPQDILTIDDVTIVNLVCADQPTGSVTINTVSGGSGNYSYNWAGFPGVTGPALTGISGGMYDVTVTDNQLGITVTGSYEVTTPALFVVQVTDIDNVLCAGDSNGSISISASGGTPGYMFDWSGDLTDNITTQVNLPAGTYSVTATDANGCVQTQSNIQVNELTDPIELSTVCSNVNFVGSGGAIDLTVSGGQPGYNFNWSGPAGFGGSTSEDLSNLSIPGTYCVTVTDAFSCTQTLCKEVYRDLSLDFSISDACADANTGAIDITVSGGTGPGTYSYSWSSLSPPGQITNDEDLTGVAGGAYSVQVEDEAGNTVVGNFVINTLPAIIVVETVTPADLGNNGTISLNVSGGDPGYTYDWSSGQDTDNISNLTPGEYCVIVTDDAGCTFEACFTVPAAPLSSSVSTTSVSCSGDENGSASIGVTGGVMPFMVTVNPGNMQFSPNSLPLNITDLAPGTYSYTVTDAQGSTFNDEFVVGEPAPLSYTFEVINDTEDAGGTGSITLSIEGGTPNYTVGWNVLATGPQIMQLTGGTYTPNIVDDNGCTLSGTIQVATLTEETAVTNVLCQGDENGSIVTTVAGGTEPYQYSWTRQGNPMVISTDPNLMDVGPGMYFVVITDATGASMVRPYAIGTQSNFAISTAVLSDYNDFGVSCADAADGELQAIVNNTGQSGSFNYEWERDGDLVGMTALLENATAGEYTLIVIDDLGCVVETTAELDGPSPLALTASVQDVGCEGVRDGQIFAAASGGVNTAPYNYVWSNEAIGPQVSFLEAGMYTVTVTDANDCFLAAAYEVFEPEPLFVMVETEPATDGCNGTASAVVIGGTPPYNYDWVNAPDAGNEAVVTGLCPGEYFVMVTDSRSCETEQGSVMGIVDDKRFPCFDDRVVITPDGNGSNDEFIIFCIGDLVDNHLEIYNRWGQLVFETDNYDNTWEGTTMSGDELPAGPYYWVLEYLGPNSETIQIRGS